MVMAKPAVLFISYNGLDDPLTYSQVVGYLRELAARGIAVHLLTFEWLLSDTQKKQFDKELAQAGITWHRLRYHKRPSFLATLYDIALGTLKSAYLCRKYYVKLVHARNYIPACIALLLNWFCDYKWLFDLRGLMAEEYVEGGNWRAGDYKFHLTKRMERTFLSDANEIVMLTERIKGELLKTESALAHRAADITVIPCCVDMSRFNLSADQRTAYRVERGWQSKRVITYVGKIGTWYLHDEMARFFAFAWQRDARFFFQVLTQSDPALLRQSLANYHVPTEAYDIRFVPSEHVPLVLAASDAGISFIRACYSKLASSPTKNGEYLAAGLPIIINAGIGDTDWQTETQRLGVVLREFSAAEFQRGVAALDELLSTSETRQRCREFAARELSLASVGGPRYASIYGRLLSPSWPNIAAVEETSARI